MLLGKNAYKQFTMITFMMGVTTIKINGDEDTKLTDASSRKYLRQSHQLQRK